MNTVDKVLAIAEAEVGYLEKKSNSQLDDKIANAGSANYTKYGRDMHMIYPAVMDFPASWCDCFVDWCFYQAYGISTAKSLLCGDFNDYTVASAQMYKAAGAWYSTPKVGDQIFFANSSRICHTGIVYKVDASKVYTIEGNTTGGSTLVANGGCVAKKSYPLTYSKIAGYGRPKYDVAPAAPAFTPYKVKVTASKLNVRAGASSGYQSYGTVSKGHIFTIRDESNGWGKVCLNLDNPKGKTVNGWVSLSYVERC